MSKLKYEQAKGSKLYKQYGLAASVVLRYNGGHWVCISGGAGGDIAMAETAELGVIGWVEMGTANITATTAGVTKVDVNTALDASYWMPLDATTIAALTEATLYDLKGLACDLMCTADTTVADSTSNRQFANADATSYKQLLIEDVDWASKCVLVKLNTKTNDRSA